MNEKNTFRGCWASERLEYRLAIFDMDGTILYTLEDLKNALNYALSKNGLPKRTLDEVRMFVGNGRMKLIECAVPDGTDEQVIRTVFTDLDSFYRNHCRENTRPYDGIPELLRSLRELGVKTAVSSNKAHTEVRSLADEFFPGLFDCAIGDRSDLRRKPYPDSALEILKQLDIPAEEAVYIGDSEVDIETGRNAGIDVISVCWGFRDEDFLRKHGASVLVHEPTEILRLIKA